MPKFSEDAVTDFLVKEALVHRAQLEKRDAVAVQKSKDMIAEGKRAALAAAQGLS